MFEAVKYISEAGSVYRVGADGQREPLDPRHDLRVHSLAGFSWGYGGSGPAQLAIALLADAADDIKAQAFYQDFKRDVIAHQPYGTPFNLDAATIRAWLLDRSTPTQT